ncbi:unnamed protein product, partial [Brachionus calyciflorus]
IILLEDYQEIIEKNTPEIAINYLNELKEKLALSYELAKKTEIVKWKKLKYTRPSNKKFDYNTGHYVLTDHPKLKKGLSHGLAHK